MSSEKTQGLAHHRSNRRAKIRLWLPIACFVLAPAIVCADSPAAQTPAPTEAQNLEQIIDRALGFNAAFQAELARRAEVAGGVTEVGADAWPQVELAGSWNRSRNPSLLNSPDFEDIIEMFPDFVPGEQELWSLAVEVEQPIYSGGKVRAAIELAELVVNITESQIHTARLNLALEVAETYFTLMFARAARDSLQSQRAAREEALKVVQDRYDLGEATELERLRATAAVAQVGPDLAQTDGNVKAAESRLRALIGWPADQNLELAVPPRAEPTTGMPASGRLLELAQRFRPELRDLDLQTDALDRQRVVTRADGKPQVDLAGAYGRQVRLLDDFEDSLFDDWRVSLGLTWKLFDGGRRKGQLAQLDSQRDQLKWRRLDLVRSVRYEIERSLADYNTTVERLRAAQIAAQATGEASRVAAESYRLGVALQADLLDAQDRAIHQELEAEAAFFDSLIQFARLRRAVGLQPSLAFNFFPPAPATADEDITP